MSYPNKKGPSKRKVKIPPKLRGKVQFIKKTSNSKVKNATACHYDGIDFKSKLEMFFYKYSKEVGIPFNYESYKTTLFEGVRLDGYLYQQNKSKNIVLDTRKILNITYSPDFYRIHRNSLNEDVLIVVETKGLKTTAYAIKKKLFLKKMNTTWGQRFYFFEPRNMHNCKQVIEIIKEL